MVKSDTQPTAHPVESIISRFIAEELAAARPRHLDRDAPLFESLLDSTSVLALVSFLETTFAIDIDDFEIVPAHFSTLRQLCDFVQKKQASRAILRGAAA